MVNAPGCGRYRAPGSLTGGRLRWSAYGCGVPSVRTVTAGSIENSTNLHATSLFEDGDVPYFRGDEVVAQMLEDAGHEPGQEFLSFCGRGYMASIDCFAGRLLGLEQVRMCDGSLTDWNARDGELLPAGGQA